MCLCASVVLPESCSDLLHFAVCVPSHEVALHKTQVFGQCEAKNYTRYARVILTLKNHGASKQNRAGSDEIWKENNFTNNYTSEVK